MTITPDGIAVMKYLGIGFILAAVRIWFDPHFRYSPMLNLDYDEGPLIMRLLAYVVVWPVAIFIILVRLLQVPYLVIIKYRHDSYKRNHARKDLHMKELHAAERDVDMLLDAPIFNNR